MRRIGAGLHFEVFEELEFFGLLLGFGGGAFGAREVLGEAFQS